MSLIHWLPLTNEIIDMVGGATIEAAPNRTLPVSGASGRLGLGYTFNNSGIQVNNVQLTGTMSFALWIKLSTHTNCHILDLRKVPGTTTEVGYQPLYYNTSSGIQIYGTAGGSSYIPCSLGTDWHHLVVTLENNQAVLYLDGAKKGQTSLTGLEKVVHATIGCRATGTNPCPGIIQDVRIYNHTLSKAEIKELARAKALHYTFDDDMSESTTNQLTYPTPGALAKKVGWDDSLHQGAITVNGWGNGYNSGVKNSSGTVNPQEGHHAMWQLINGVPTIVFNNLNNKYSSPNRWLGVSGGVTTAVRSILPGKTVTLSYEAKSTNPGMRVGIGLHYTPTGSTAANFYDQNNGSTGARYQNTTTEWKKYSNTFIVRSTLDTSKDAKVYVYGHGGAEGTTFVRNIQMEFKDRPTLYTSSSRDGVLANEAGYSANILANDVEYVTASKIGQRAIYCKDGLQRISATIPYLTTDVLSTSVWFKSSNTNPKNGYHILLAVDSGRVEISIPSNGQLRFGGYNKTASNRFCSNFSATLLDGNWHLINTVFDGLTWKGYVDGVLKGTITVTSTKGDSPIVYSNKKLTIGRYYDNATDNYGATDAYIDDVRIYNSVLTVDDIKDIYNVGAKITVSGDILTNNFIEEKTSTVTKKHTVESSELKEDFTAGAGYERLDYIEFSGAEYINTGLAFSNANIPIIIEADIVKTQLSSNNCLAGCGNSAWTGPVMLNCHNGTCEFGVNGYATASDGSGSITANERLLIRAELYTKKENHNWYKNGKKINLGTNAYKDRTGSTSTLYIGAFHVGTGTSIASGSCWIGRLYSFKVWYGGSLRFLVPARRTADGVLGLYDMAGTGFYTNIGGGTLKVGQNINKTEAKFYKNGSILGRTINEL